MRALTSENLDTDMRGLLLLFWRRKFLIGGFILGGVALAALALTFVTPQYAGRSLLLVNTKANEIVPADIAGNQGERGRYDSSLILGEVEIVRSRSMARDVIERLGFTNDPEFAKRKSGSKEERNDEAATRFLSHLTARAVPGTYAIQIEFRSSNAERAAKVANTIADAYIEKSLEENFAATQKLADWLESRLSSLRAELRAREIAIQRYRADNNIMEGTTTLLSTEQVTAINAELAEAKAKAAEAEARLGNIKTNSAPMMDSDVIQKLKLDQARSEAGLSELSSRYGPKHPEILKLQSEIAEIKNSIEGEIEKIGASVENELTFARARVRALEEGLLDAGGQRLMDDERMVGLRALETEAESTRLTLNTFLQTYNRADRQEELQQPSAKVLSYAVTPRAAIYPNTPLSLSLSLIVSLFAGLCASLLLEKLDNTFRTTAQIESALGLPCFGLIPSVGKLRPPFLSRYPLLKPASPLAESVRTLRMVMNLRSQKRKPKVVMLTSSFPDEGKTTLSLWLGRLAALSGEKVLIIDADLRRPNVARASGQNNRATLGDYLNDKCEIGKIICKDGESPAHLIFARGAAHNALDLVGTDKMRAMVTALKDRYDLIIIDSPAAMAVPDARVLATLSDLVLYAVRWDKTPRDTVVAGVKSFTDIGYGKLAMVLTNVDVKKHAAYGYGDAVAYYGRYQKREAA